MCVCLFVRPSVRRSVCLSARPSVCLCVYVCVCVWVCGCVGVWVCGGGGGGGGGGGLGGWVGARGRVCMFVRLCECVLERAPRQPAGHEETTRTNNSQSPPGDPRRRDQQVTTERLKTTKRPPRHHGQTSGAAMLPPKCRRNSAVLAGVGTAVRMFYPHIQVRFRIPERSNMLAPNHWRDSEFSRSKDEPWTGISHGRPEAVRPQQTPDCLGRKLDFVCFGQVLNPQPSIIAGILEGILQELTETRNLRSCCRVQDILGLA